MRNAVGDGFAEHLAAVEPDIVVEWTRFVEAYPPTSNMDPDEDDGAHLYKLIQAAFFRDVRTIHEWKDQADTYPLKALTKEQVGSAQNPDVQVRAHYLKSALTRLLTMVGAPEAMMADMQSILDEHAPRSADLRADAQAKWSKDPETNLRQIARKQARNHGQLYKDRDAGLLIKPSIGFKPTLKAKKTGK